MTGSKHGFTLVEVALVVVVLGILTTLAVNHFRQTVAFDELEKTSHNVCRELSSVRAIALKNDCGVFVRFSDSRCSLYVDTNENGTIDKNEFDRCFAITSPVRIGIARDGPLSGPPGIDFATGGIAGNWKNTMQVSNGSASAINSGAIYLQSPRLKKRTFCIGLSTAMQAIKLYSWDGSRWNVL